MIFDVSAWHRACAAHGLALTRFAVPQFGGVGAMQGVLNGQPVEAWMFMGMVSLWAMVKCRACDCDIAVDDGKAENTAESLADAIVRALADARCARCRDAQR